MAWWAAQILIFLLGMAGNLIASAVYELYTKGKSDRAAALRAKEDRWRARLTSQDEDVRAHAYREVLMRVLRWNLLGNVMFGISGLAWLMDFLRIYAASNAVAAGSSLVAVIMFGVALSWIKRYLRYATP
jgi:hypothetical protein